MSEKNSAPQNAPREPAVSTGSQALSGSMPSASDPEASPEQHHPLLRRFGMLARRNVLLIIAIVCIVVFLALLEDVLEGDIMRIDSLAYSTIVVGWRSDTLTPLMEGLSSLATPLVLIVMLVVVSAFAPGSRPGWCAALNLACAFCLNQLLKFLIQRPRPEDIQLVDASGYSFPSGHSMVAMAFYGLLIWMIWHYDRNRIERWVMCILLALVIVGIGVSRVYLGVHYASDVLAGFCVSLAWLILYTRLIAPLFLDAIPARPDDRFPPEQIETGLSAQPATGALPRQDGQNAQNKQDEQVARSAQSDGKATAGQ
jgi:membrane-associated phospholipid phosphatase